MKNAKATTLKQCTSVEEDLINTNQQKTKNWLDHPFDFNVSTLWKKGQEASDM